MFNEKELGDLIKRSMLIKICVRDEYGKRIDSIYKTYMPPIGSKIRNVRFDDYNSYYDAIVQEIYIEDNVDEVDIYVSKIEYK